MKAKDWLNRKVELECNRCGRKSVESREHHLCLFPQPNGSNCGGTFQIQKTN